MAFLSQMYYGSKHCHLKYIIHEIYLIRMWNKRFYRINAHTFYISTETIKRYNAGDRMNVLI